MSERQQVFRQTDLRGALTDLRWRAVNFDAADAGGFAERRGWHHDEEVEQLPGEAPGAPVPGGSWEAACALVRDYEFPEPAIIRAVFDPSGPLLGRDLLLEGRFAGLRFFMGVRVCTVIDETRGTGADARRVWGWGYRTLAGHLEQGQLDYEVSKHLASGQVEFRIAGFSRPARIPNPIVRYGFLVFGRPTQLRFYRTALERMRRLVEAEMAGEAPPRPVPGAPGAAGLVLAPSDARPHPLERLTSRSRHPGADGGDD